jgi:hypothetical protein
MWDRMLPQAILTLNITLRINPKISAATHLNGQYEYNRAPMAPPHTIIIAHETPHRRRAWAPHGQDGWGIGPALEHYRCYRVYIHKTRSERVVETVELFPTDVKVNFQSSRDLTTETTPHLKYALVNPQPAGPFAQVGDDQLIALKKLAALFEGALPKHKQQTANPLLNNDSSSPPRVDIIGSRTRDCAKAEPGLVKKIADPAIFNQSSGKSVSIFPRGSRGPGKTPKSRSLLHLNYKR